MLRFADILRHCVITTLSEAIFQDKNVSPEREILMAGVLGFIEGATLNWLKRKKISRQKLNTFIFDRVSTLML